jgi:hypothetical protein
MGDGARARDRSGEVRRRVRRPGEQGRRATLGGLEQAREDVGGHVADGRQGRLRPERDAAAAGDRVHQVPRVGVARLAQLTRRVAIPADEGREPRVQLGVALGGEDEQPLAAEVPHRDRGARREAMAERQVHRERVAGVHRLGRDLARLADIVDQPELQLPETEPPYLLGRPQVRELDLHLREAERQRADERLDPLELEVWDATDPHTATM